MEIITDRCVSKGLGSRWIANISVVIATEGQTLHRQIAFKWSNYSVAQTR